MGKLSDRQKKNISKHLVLTRTEWGIIKNNNYDWGCSKLKEIRDKFRDFYRKEQNNLCAYCKLPFRDDVQVEHIVPKSGKYGRKEFTFYSLNLVVSCKHCNSKKSVNNDMIPWNSKIYPKAGIYFKIVHSHFEDYFKHITIEDKSRYVMKTLKGHKTIERCKLYDPVIIDVLVKSMRYEDDALINGVLRIRDLQGNFKIIIDRFIERIFKQI